MRRLTATSLLLAAGLLALPFAVGAEEAPAPALPERVQAELAAAHRVRSTLAEEKQAWAMERERLQLLLSAVRRRTDGLKADAADADTTRDALAKRVAELTKAQDSLDAVEAMLDALAETLEKDLGTLAKEALPGLVPPDTAAGLTDPARRFDAAVARLDDTTGRLANATVEIVSGTLEGQEATVKLLRVGNAAAWWLALDGSRAGTARQTDGALALKPLESAEAVEAIQKAFAVAEGRAAPDWVVLPADHVKTQRE